MDRDFKKKFLRSTASSSIGQVISLLGHFGSLMIITRVVAKWEFGVYALIVVIVNQFISFSGLGLDTTLVKFFSESKIIDRSDIFKKIFLIRTLSVIFFILIYLITSPLFIVYFDESINDYYIYVILFFFLGNYRDLFYKIFQGLNQFNKYALSQVASSLIRFVIILILYINVEINLEFLLIIEISSLIITIFVQSILIPWKEILLSNSGKVELKSILKFSVPIYFNNLFSAIHRRFNLLLVGLLLSPLSVAYFDVGSKIPKAIRKSFNPFIIVYFPNLSKLFSKRDNEDAVSLINKSLASLSFILSFGVLIAFIFRTEIITLLFSEKYLDSSMVFSVLMFNLSLSVIATVLGYSNLSAGYPKVPMKVNFFVGILSLLGSFLLIPEFGFIGAAYSLILMNIVAQLLYVFYLNNISVKIRVLNYIKPILLLFITAGTYTLIGTDFIIYKILSIVVFLIGCYLIIPEFKAILSLANKLIPKLKSW